MKACEEISEASVTPWILLSAAVDYETFLRQVTIACQSGASGIAVGRAVWQEAVSVLGEERTEFLRNIAYQRMTRLSSLCYASRSHGLNSTQLKFLLIGTKPINKIEFLLITF